LPTRRIIGCLSEKKEKPRQKRDLGF
jgi:hypothetical protein